MSDGIRVLHVDDDPDFGELTAILLERVDARFTVETVSSADEGLARFTTERFDCLVSDYDMPEKTGIDFLEAVHEAYPDFPFILFTGKGSEEIASDAISAGVTDYLQKGSGTDHYSLLANRISNAVSRHRAEKAEQWMHELGEKSDDVLWMFTSDWEELLFVNSAYERVWGQTTTSLHRRPETFFDGIHPEDRPRVKAAMDDLAKGDSIEVEYRVNEREQYSRWVWARGHPITDDDGTVVRVTGFTRDVTDRKEREEERRATVEFLRNLSDVTTDPTLTVREKIDQLLAQGCEKLDSPYGIVTAIEFDGEQPDSNHGTQTVVVSHGSHERIHPGQSCSLSKAYCRETIEQDDLLTVHDVRATDWERTSADERFGFGSYIGGKLLVDDELYGTLCFASQTPRDRPFTDAQKTFVKLVSKWVSYEVEHELTRSDDDDATLKTRLGGD
ncbi:PAS domain S-box-containing protein [Halogranum rubrum]|uniref:PAS domain S-box-containing protein n=1 Tax=Halogranum rubrum TaxID=553466 RepID=A0A1I4F8D3_9EURY|nr:response regulator [Halogranum rubrum]SFL13056.1 PAS domain S-box-containing protein [Halogranum rubrum]